MLRFPVSVKETIAECFTTVFLLKKYLLMAYMICSLWPFQHSEVLVSGIIGEGRTGVFECLFVQIFTVFTDFTVFLTNVAHLKISVATRPNELCSYFHDCGITFFKGG